MSELDYDRLGQILANRLLPKIVEDLAAEVRVRVADILKGDIEFMRQVRGPAGEVGATGPRGESGPPGDKGQAGETGAAGRDGTTVEELLTEKAFGGAIRMHVLDVMEKTARHRDERAEQAGKSLGPILVELFRHRRQVLHDKIAKTKGSDTQIAPILQDHAKLLRGKLDYTIEPICRAIWYMRTNTPYMPEVMNGLGPQSR